MRIKRTSIILDGIGTLMRRFRSTCAKSFLLGYLSGLYAKAETGHRNGLLGALGDRERDRNAWQYRMRRRWMHLFEDSVLLRASRRLDRILLQTSVGSFACFFFLYGALVTAMWFAFDDRPLRDLFFALLSFLLSLPALHGNRPLARAMQNSFFLSPFLYGFCDLPKPMSELGAKGTAHPWIALSAAVLTAGSSRILSPWYLLLFLAICVAVRLLFSVPELGVCGFFLLLPLYNLFSHPTVLLILFVLLIHATWLRRALCGRRPMRLSLLDLTVLFLCLLYVTCGIVSVGGRASLAAGGVSALCISLWFPTVSLLSSAVWRRRAGYAMAIGCVGCSLFGIAQYLFGEQRLQWVDPVRFADIGTRVCAVFSNPNVFAVFLLLTAPFVVGICARRFSVPRLRVPLCFAVLSVLLCTVFTWSRGAWLGILAAGILFLLLYSPASMGTLFVCIPLAVAALPLLPHSIQNRFSSIGLLTETSIRYRLYTWRGVLRLLQHYPFGVGAGRDAFARAFRPFAVSGTETVLHAHNLFLRIACELGIGGLCVFLLFVRLFVLCGIERLQRERDRGERTMVLCCFCAFVAVMIMGMFDDIWYHYGLFALFWGMCACMSAGRRTEAEEVTEQ